MNYGEFLTQVIDNGLKSVASDERITKRAKRLEGAKAGFEACRGKDPVQLKELLGAANRKSALAREEKDIEEYWKAVYYALQIEWVCNTVSAMLMNEGLQVIVPPTARGAINAAKVAGVKDEPART